LALFNGFCHFGHFGPAGSHLQHCNTFIFESSECMVSVTLASAPGPAGWSPEHFFGFRQMGLFLPFWHRPAVAEADGSVLAVLPLRLPASPLYFLFFALIFFSRLYAWCPGGVSFLGFAD
jgi:hypothetical protein